METLDFSKYAGTYTLKEVDGVLANMKADILEKEKQIACKKAQEMHGNKFTYEVKKGTAVDLRKLQQGQKVCACDVKGHHILMTEKSA